MGRGIAGACALAGYETAVFEADPAARRGLPGSIQLSWRKAADRGKIPGEAVEKAQARLRVLETLEEGTGAELVIEAVPEILSIKRETLASLDRSCPPATVLASN